MVFLLVLCSNGSNITDEGSYAYAQSLGQNSSTEEYERHEFTNEEIRQATTRLSRAREQLSRFNHERMSATANTMYSNLGHSIPDYSAGMYDLPARPMTS